MSKIIHRTYKFKLKPNQQQQQLLAKHFGCTRFVFNHFLDERQQAFKLTGKSPNYNAQAVNLTALKHSDCPWLSEVNSQSLQAALKHVDLAYMNFFNKKQGFPKFKSKKAKNSFSVPQHCSVDDYKIYIPKFREGISYFKDRKVKGVVKSMTITLTPTGKYYVSILTEQDYTPFDKTHMSVGIDMGLKNFIVTSEGLIYPNHKIIHKYENKLATAQKHLSRKKRGSNNYEKQRIKVAKLHEKVRDARTDYLHKVSLELIKRYDIICCEDLNIRGMMKNHRLAKSIGDAGWGEFIRMIEYKADMNDKEVIKIDRYYPSTKRCHKCGYINEGLTLRDREWTCPECGEKIDRDWNAAQNILLAGLANYTCGVSVNPILVGNCETSTPLL